MEKDLINLVYLSLGSNIGDKKKYIDKAIDILNTRIGKITNQSKYHTTPAVDMPNADDFVNVCVELQTIFKPEELLNQLKIIEIELGRDKNSKGKNKSRKIDLDIIFFNQLIYCSKDLIIPHPRYHLRKFVLIPLIEIAPRICDPSLKLSLKELIN